MQHPTQATPTSPPGSRCIETQPPAGLSPFAQHPDQEIVFHSFIIAGSKSSKTLPNSSELLHSSKDCKFQDDGSPPPPPQRQSNSGKNACLICTMNIKS